MIQRKLFKVLWIPLTKICVFFSQVGKHQCNLIGFEIVVYGGGLKKLQLDQVKEKQLVAETVGSDRDFVRTSSGNQNFSIYLAMENCWW